MNKELQKILNLPPSKLVPQVSDDKEYYGRIIKTYENILRMADEEKETRRIYNLKETMYNYLRLAKLQREHLEVWGNGSLNWIGM
jgi:uncharacterized membrane protein